MSYMTQKVLDAEVQTGREYKAARKAREIELNKINNGWRYISISPRMTILVPCDDNGQPTEDGLARIERRKKMLMI